MEEINANENANGQIGTAKAKSLDFLLIGQFVIFGIALAFFVMLSINSVIFNNAIVANEPNEQYFEKRVETLRASVYQSQL